MWEEGARRGYGKTCNYCGKICYNYCSTCFELGYGLFHVCGMKSGRKDACMKAHATGVQPAHGNFAMHTPSKSRMADSQQVRRAKEKAGATGDDYEDCGDNLFGSSDDSDDSGDDSGDDRDELAPVGSPLRESQRGKEKKRKAEREARKEDKAKKREKKKAEAATLARAERRKMRACQL